MRSATKQLTARTVQKSRSSCWRILPITFLQRLCCQRTSCSSSVHKGYDEPETLLDQIVKSVPKALTTDSLSGLAVMARHPAPVGPIATSRQCWLDRPAKNDLSDNGCCQTNEPTHQYLLTDLASSFLDALRYSNVATNAAILPGHSMRRTAFTLLSICICVFNFGCGSRI